MPFSLTPQQLEFRDTVRAVLAKECSPADVRDAYQSPTWRTPRWSTLTELGVVGLGVPEDHGGLGLGMVDMVVVLEEAGRVALPEPLAATAAVCAPLLVDLEEHHPSDDRWATWLEGVATGRVAAAVGLGPEAEPVAAADGATLYVLGRPADGPEAAIFLMAADGARRRVNAPSSRSLPSTPLAAWPGWCRPSTSDRWPPDRWPPSWPAARRGGRRWPRRPSLWACPIASSPSEPSTPAPVSSSADLSAASRRSNTCWPAPG